MSKWIIDNAHASVSFQIQHLGISWVRGQFYDVSGEVEFDPADVEQASFMGNVKVDSISTGVDQRDGHLLSPDFFDAANFPEIKFTSKSVTGNNDKMMVTGDLTIKDVTKEVELELVFHGVQENGSAEQVAAFTGTTQIDREEFGLTWNMDVPGGKKLVGTKVNLIIEVEAKSKV